MKALLLFLTAIVLFSTISCEKNDPYKRSKELHRFFRCKVNGREWHNEGFGFYGDGSQMEYYIAPDSIENSGRFFAKIDNYPNKSKNEYINIYIKRDLKEGDNLINYLDYQGSIYGNLSKSPWKIYDLDSNYHNNLYITDIDSTNKIITGQFEFRAINRYDSTDFVLVTDGEFDWKPYWYIYK